MKKKKQLGPSTLLDKSYTNGKYTYNLSLLRAKRYNALPPFLDTPDNLKKVLQIYISAQFKNLTTHKRYHVDHIIPLCGDNVCGLHSAANLRIISKTANEAKSNAFTPYVTDGQKKELLAPAVKSSYIYQSKKKKSNNPTKKSFKRRARRLIFRKRNFS